MLGVENGFGPCDDSDMNLPDVMIYGLITFLILLELTVVVSFWAYYRLHSRYVKLLEEREREKINFEAQSVAVAEEAQRQAESLLREATAKAEEIVKRSQLLTDDLSQKLAQDLQRLPQVQEEVYRQVFEGVEKETKQLLVQVAKEMQQQAMDQTKSFGAVLQKEAINSQESVKQMIADAYARAEQEIEAYKKQRMAQVDASIQQLVAEVSREVLGKVLTSRDHEDLVIQALEKGKGQLVS